MLLTQFNIALHVDADTLGLVCAGAHEFDRKQSDIC